MINFDQPANHLVRVSGSLHESSRRSYATVIPFDPKIGLTETWLKEVLKGYRSINDGFRVAFLSGVIFTGATGGKDPDISLGIVRLLTSLGTCWIEVLDDSAVYDAPPSGSYVTVEQQLLGNFRLYDDIQGAFMNGINPSYDS